MLATLILATIAAIGPIRESTAGGTKPAIELEPIGSFRTGPHKTMAAEIVVYDAATRCLFVANSYLNGFDVISIADPSRPERIWSKPLGEFGGGVNSIAIHGGLVAVAVQGHVKTDPGRVVIFDTGGTLVGLVEVGALPDMLIFTPDGRHIVVANEGEPSDDYSVDPEGTISIIELPQDPRRLGQRHVRTADFRHLIVQGLDPRIRVFGPGASPAQDLEPEYIAVSGDSSTAYVVLQENNAMATVDIANATVSAIVPLGFKDHMLPGNGFDASDRDGAIRIANWPVRGLYQPDTTVLCEIAGTEYLVMADEGDSRNYPGFRETVRVSELVLDPDAFPNAAELQRDENLGRLLVSRVSGDPDGDGRHESLYSFGGRGFSIRDTAGRLVFESGDGFERLVAAAVPEGFNCDNETNDSFDQRSDDRGPEPEAVTTGVIDGRTYAFIGLERVGGVVVYDISEPARSTPVGYWTTRNFTGNPAIGTAGDLGPESMAFIPAALSPNGAALLVSANEISGTVTVSVVRPN